MEINVVSSFFSRNSNDNEEDNLDSEQGLSDNFLHIIDELNLKLEEFKLPSNVDCAYNPTVYARHTFEMYVRKYCSTKKSVMYFGMNPGPWGMSQTGVPFGEVSSVRDWLEINGPVNKPAKEIAARPIKGFDCPRTEISGKRFWGLFKNLCNKPAKFFETSFVYNYIPVQWMKSNGCNLTPGDFRATEMQDLFKICDPIFIKVLELYDVETIVAVGKFCETRAQKALKKYGTTHPVQIVYLPHPSPRTVNNNKWEQKAVECLKKLDLYKYYADCTT